jgi:hypothetical protein
MNPISGYVFIWILKGRDHLEDVDVDGRTIFVVRLRYKLVTSRK